MSLAGCGVGRLSPRIIYGALGIGLTILAVGCRDRRRDEEARLQRQAQEARVSLEQRMNLETRFRRDDPIPFTPVPGEVAPAHPCGPKRRGPCLLLGWEFYNFAWGYTHSAWFMDTDGNEYEFAFHGWEHRDAGSKAVDPVREALIDHHVSPDDFATIVAASTARPRRVTADEVAHALSLLAASRDGAIETIRDGACTDAGGSGIDGYLFEPDKKGSSQLLLSDEQCNFLLKQNTSHAARELAQWVHKLRGTARPFGGPK